MHHRTGTARAVDSGPALPPFADAAHALWDELADIDASRVDQAREALLSGLCRLAGAANACWVGAVRMSHGEAGDPLSGWRPRLIRYLYPDRQLGEASDNAARRLDRDRPPPIDASTAGNVAGAGRYRSNRLVDLVPPGWFEDEFYRGFYLGNGHADAIWAAAPIDPEAEIYVGLFRETGRPPFTEVERDAVGYAMRGLRWFHRLQMLGHGLGVDAAPLTDLEQRVLHCLLRGRTGKQIARELALSPATVNEYSARIYRKYAVAGRGELTALWLGVSPGAAEPDAA